MTIIKTKTLEALKSTDAGLRLSDGGSLFGVVRASTTKNDSISVYFEWCFKIKGKKRQLRIGSWPKMSLRALRQLRDELAIDVPDVIERCLNHTEESKMKRIYQRASYEGQMRDAWTLWGSRLDLLKNKPNNVLTLIAA